MFLTLKNQKQALVEISLMCVYKNGERQGEKVKEKHERTLQIFWK